MKNILLVLAFFLTFIITFDLFLKEPPVWPDEASLVQMSDLSKGNLIDDYQRYPSIYITLLPLWFRMTGVSVEAQRVPSLFAGVLYIIIFWLLISKIPTTFPKRSFLKIVPVILLATDFTFLQATRVGRPEAFTLLFGLSSVYLLYLFISREFKNIYLLGFSFATALLSFVFHANGLIYVATVLITTTLFFIKFPRRNQKMVTIFTFSLTPFLIFLGLRIMPSLVGNIINRLRIADAQDTWLYTVFSVKPLELKLMYALFILITLLFLFYIIKRRKFNLSVIALPLVLSWLVLIFNKDFWYAVYLIPFVYVASFILLVEKYKDKFKFYNLIFICLIIFLSNLKFHATILSEEGGDRYSYQNFIVGIQQVIPDGKSVFTSSIPDPYYAFVTRKNNKLTRFPQSFVEKETYINDLDQSDYIIYNGAWGINYYGDLVNQYIQKNTFKTTRIGGPDQYNAIIVELNPRDQRVAP